jgi:hypothetical protein
MTATAGAVVAVMRVDEAPLATPGEATALIAGAQRAPHPTGGLGTVGQERLDDQRQRVDVRGAREPVDRSRGTTLPVGVGAELGTSGVERDEQRRADLGGNPGVDHHRTVVLRVRAQVLLEHLTVRQLDLLPAQGQAGGRFGSRRATGILRPRAGIDRLHPTWLGGHPDGCSPRKEPTMRHRLIPTMLLTVAATIGLAFAVSPAGAAPTGAKNAFTGSADCGSAGQFTFVVNSANGQGQGTQNNGNQAEFTPAHLIGTHQVFHPTQFDLTFTFTPVNGPSQSFTNTDSRRNQTGDTVCSISGAQTDPAGNTFSLSGTVEGWIS